MDIYEREDLKEFLISLYGTQARSWPMNDRMFDLTYELVAESGRCTGMMDLVPRPMRPGASPITYITTQIRGAFLRTLRQNKKHYVACVKVLADKMATRFHEAARGL